ncbi:MAG: radical SAM protein [Desulfopila sp.]
MLLIHPPVAKASEPPAGIAQLAGALLAHNHGCAVADLNLDGLLYLIDHAEAGNDRWSIRAQKNRSTNLNSIRSAELYTTIARYQKTVLELNRLVGLHGAPGTTAGLANYQDSNFSPVKSDDLHRMAHSPEKNLFYSFYCKHIPLLLDKHQPHSIGISINYLSQALPAFALIGFLKKFAAELPIIAGGGLITSWMRTPNWSNPFTGLIDHCIDGPGKQPLLELLGTTANHTSVPRYDLLPLDRYLAPGVIVPYSCSSGCFWNKCNFCPERAEGSMFTCKEGTAVIDDIISLQEQTAPTLLHFLDNAIPPSILQHFSEKTPGMPWYGFIRITHHLLDASFCRRLRKSGCCMLKIGIESGDQGVLDHMEKGVDLASISTVLSNLGKAGIATYVYLLFGTPGEGYAEAGKTLSLVCRHHGDITFLNLAIFNMPINTQQTSALQTRRFYEGDLSLYTDFHHPLGWSRKKIRLFLDREFKKQPVIQEILQRDPMIFTSNHAPFFSKGFQHKHDI